MARCEHRRSYNPDKHHPVQFHLDLEPNTIMAYLRDKPGSYWFDWTKPWWDDEWGTIWFTQLNTAVLFRMFFSEHCRGVR